MTSVVSPLVTTLVVRPHTMPANAPGKASAHDHVSADVVDVRRAARVMIGNTLVTQAERIYKNVAISGHPMQVAQTAIRASSNALASIVLTDILPQAMNATVQLEEIETARARDIKLAIISAYDRGILAGSQLEAKDESGGKYTNMMRKRVHTPAEASEFGPLILHMQKSNEITDDILADVNRAGPGSQGRC